MWILGVRQKPQKRLEPLELLNPYLGARQKHQKPLALDARCLLRAIDVAAARKSLSKLRYFQPPTSSPLLGLCIHRKAINIDKHLSSGVPPR